MGAGLPTNCATTELGAKKIVGFIVIQRGKFFDWKERYGLAKEHNKPGSQGPPPHQ